MTTKKNDTFSELVKTINNDYVILEQDSKEGKGGSKQFTFTLVPPKKSK